MPSTRPKPRGPVITSALLATMLLTLIVPIMPSPHGFGIGAEAQTTGQAPGQTTGQDEDEATSEPAAEPTGSRLLRIYGCHDALAASTAPAPRPFATRDGILAPETHPVVAAETDGIVRDGWPDCTGDLLRLDPVLLSTAASPELRRLLGGLDQWVDLAVRYEPVVWRPAPETTPPAPALDAQGTPLSLPALPSVADPVDPARGLFDLPGADGQPDGRFAPLFVTDEEAGPARDGDALPHPVDADGDGLADIAGRSVAPGRAADLHFEGIVLDHRFGWTTPEGAPAYVADGGSFAFPFRPRDDAGSGLAGWTYNGQSVPVAWHARPFGLGTLDDGRGALVTAPIELAADESLAFLDHAVAVDGFFGTTDDPSVRLQVLYTGGTDRQVLHDGLVLAPAAHGEEGRVATLADAGSGARNLAAADRIGARLGPPGGPDSGTESDDGWFVLVEETDGADAESPRVRLRLGRLVATEAPLNLVFAHGGLYLFDHVDERAGRLYGLGLDRVVPVGGPFGFFSPDVVVAGVAMGAELPMLPPFDRDHVRTAALAPPVATDAYGFWTGTTAGPIGNDDLAWATGLEDLRDRARTAPPVVIRLMARGTEDRLHALTVPPDGDAASALVRVEPSRWAALVTGETRVAVQSVLLDDQGVLHDATAAPLGPRAMRDRPFDPARPEGVFLGDEVLLHGMTHGGAGLEVLRPDPAVLLWSDHTGHIRAPDQLAHQQVDLEVAYGPYTRFGPDDDVRALRPLTDEMVAPWMDHGSAADLVDGVAPDEPDHAGDAATDATDPDGTTRYAPALHLRYGHRLLSRIDMAPIQPALGPHTQMLLPVADQGVERPGLDTWDADGDGAPDPVRLSGFWDISGHNGGPPGFAAPGTPFTNGGTGNDTDLLWLQSRSFSLDVGDQVQFFDHGVRFLGLDPSDDRAGRFLVLDHAPAEGPAARGEVLGVTPDMRACMIVRHDGVVPPAARDCASIQLSPPAPERDPGDAEVLWWAQAEAVSASRATVVLNRVVTDVDRAAMGDQTRMVVGGRVYTWGPVEVGTGGEGDGFVSLGMTEIVPLATVTLPHRGGTVTGVPADGPVVPMLPFSMDHRRLRQVDVEVERDPYGFPDARLDNQDPDIVRTMAADRVVDAPALVLTVAGSGSLPTMGVHHDLARRLDTARAGPFFTGGAHASPGAGLEALHGDAAPPPDLRTDAAAGFPEALRSGDDRGWGDHARIVLPEDGGPWSLVTERVGRTGLHGVGWHLVSEDGVPAYRPHGHGTGPEDADLSAVTAPSPATVVLRIEPGELRDLYVDVATGMNIPPAEPTPGPDATDPAAEGPTSTTDRQDEDAPGPPVAGVLFAVLIGSGLCRSRRRAE